MSCCGKKRQEWQRERTAVTRQTSVEDAPQRAQEPPREFEYLGQRALTVRGLHTGSSYTFRYPGERLKVDYQDSLALIAEGALRVVA